MISPADASPRSELEVTKRVIDVEGESPVRLTLDYELSRVPIAKAAARLVVDGADEEMLSVDIEPTSLRRLEIQRAGGEVFPAGASVHLEVEKFGDAPRLASKVWTSRPPAGGMIEFPELVTAAALFEARERDVLGDLRDADEKSAKHLVFEHFLADWDRETFTTEDVTSTWTDLADPPSNLGPEAIEARREAIDAFSKLLFDRARLRGLDMDVPGYGDLSAGEKGQLNLIAELHERLFLRHFGPRDQLDPYQLGLRFIEFATCVYLRKVTVHAVTYQNGRPNGAILITLAELADLLAERDGRQGLWHALHPSMVGCIAAYASSHKEGDRAKLGRYGLDSFRSGRRLSHEQTSFLGALVNGFALLGTLESHWSQLLYLLAPGSFDQERTRMAFGLEQYVGATVV